MPSDMTQAWNENRLKNKIEKSNNQSRELTHVIEVFYAIISGNGNGSKSIPCVYPQSNLTHRDFLSAEVPFSQIIPSLCETDKKTRTVSLSLKNIVRTKTHTEMGHFFGIEHLYYAIFACRHTFASDVSAQGDFMTRGCYSCVLC